jgi:hypothetical protein
MPIERLDEALPGVYSAKHRRYPAIRRGVPSSPRRIDRAVPSQISLRYAVRFRDELLTLREFGMVWYTMHKLYAAGLFFLALTIINSAASVAQTASDSRVPSDTFTIYVEDGNPNGHVFMTLSTGTDTVTRGFYSKYKTLPLKALALVGLGGGEVRDDAHTDWSVRRVYRIDAQQYDAGQKLLAAWEGGNRTWWITNHCGDFVEGFAKAMGIAPDLPWHATGRNRPGVFGAYLLAHGGETNVAHWSVDDLLSRMDKLYSDLARMKVHLAEMDMRKDRDLREAGALQDKYQAVHDPQYAAYMQHCNVTLPPDQAAQRKAECDPTFAALQKLRLDFEVQRKPYIDGYHALDAQEPVQKAQVDAQRAALLPVVANANARSSLRKTQCATNAGVDEQARCYILYRNNGKM